MKPAQQMMIDMWRRNTKKQKGKRFKEKEKAMFLSIYKTSPKGYRNQKNLFDAPNVSTLKKMEADIPFYTGIIQIFTK